MKRLLPAVVIFISCAAWCRPAAGQSNPDPPAQPADTTIVPVNTTGLRVRQLTDTAAVRNNRFVRSTVKRGKKNDSRITCGCGIDPKAPPAIYINGRLSDNDVLNAISPKEITSIRILKRDSLEIDGKIYKGVVAIETKNGLAL